MGTTLIVIIISAIVQLVIIYFVIEGATKSRRNIEQNEEIIKLMRMLVKTSDSSKIDYFNSYNKMNVRAIDTDPKGETIEVETKWLFYFIDRFSEESKKKIIEARERQEQTMVFNFRELNDAMSKDM